MILNLLEKDLPSGDFWVVQGYPDNIFRELDADERKKVDFIIPEKGGTAYVDSFVILSNAPHKENAYKFNRIYPQTRNICSISRYIRNTIY